jgi:hypothetical protein
MQMSHIYQPLMLKLLIERGGRASTGCIAAAVLSHDESQLDYYETIVNRMPGVVLPKYGTRSQRIKCGSSDTTPMISLRIRDIVTTSPDPLFTLHTIYFTLLWRGEPIAGQ